MMVHLHYENCVCRGDGTNCAVMRYWAVPINEWFMFGKPQTADQYLAVREVHRGDAAAGLVPLTPFLAEEVFPIERPPTPVQQNIVSFLPTPSGNNGFSIRRNNN